MAKQTELAFDSLSKDDLGDINITTGVLETIAAKAASEIPGTHSGANQFQKEIGSFIGLDRRKVDASVERNEVGELSIDIDVHVVYGYAVPDVALQIQDRVKEQILYMTDVTIQEVNVHIVSIETDSERETGELGE